MSWGLTPLQASLALPSRLVRMLRTSIEGAMRAMGYTAQDVPLGGPVTFAFVRDAHAGNVC
jgi:hypothetical protein